ncbi:MAG TPA: hypothetical protein DCX60_08630, partial [Phycisphaerales bacterium]|nr:hypothetical protein [Phycisphaerales bacterium]
DAAEAPAVIGVEKQSAEARKEVEADAAKDEVLQELLGAEDSTDEAAPKPAADSIPEASADVDLGMIDGLLEDSDGEGGKD